MVALGLAGCGSFEGGDRGEPWGPALEDEVAVPREATAEAPGEPPRVDDKADAIAPEDDTAIDDGAVDDALVPDTLVADTFVADTFVPDTFVPDTFVPDAFVADTFVPDTFVPDTFVADTFVPDTFVPDTVADTFVADTFVADTFVADTFVADTFVSDTFVPETLADARADSAAETSVTDAAPPPTVATTDYAPYFYTWGWGNPVYPFTSLVDMFDKTGLDGVTLAFVVSSGGACTATRGIPNHQADIEAYRAKGGRVKASFGGASGKYLENTCADAASLAAVITAFVDETGITDLDFDVEQAIAMNATINARRAAALLEVQKKRGIQVSFTLAANPRVGTTAGGITAASVEVVRAALAAGVRVSHVNLMTMDYGTYYSSGRKMGDLAISALTDALAQLKKLIPGLTDAEGWQMLGATPMIGVNDVLSEVFTLADAKTLADFAKAKRLGLVAFWAIQRDQPCAGELDLVLCTGAQTAKYQFHQVLRTVR
ncbi:MAG: hypothetical protein HYV09_07590 [Deltaproteobacteria bacterium]|nr:hypothetical protein [Deltaproteobacteria bacterium]